MATQIPQDVCDKVFDLLPVGKPINLKEAERITGYDQYYCWFVLAQLSRGGRIAFAGGTQMHNVCWKKEG